MTLDTIRTRPTRSVVPPDEPADGRVARSTDDTDDHATDGSKRGDGASGPTGVVEVSDLPTVRVRAIADDADVYFERRGGRTYLVPAN